jgi:hypothetical protein
MTSKFAFPGSSDMSNGMTLRDYFAAQVAAGDAAADQGWGAVTEEAMLGRARMYYRIADAMLQAREE